VSDQRWGATPEEWGHWHSWLKLTDDLLPVVCRPNAAIDVSSKIKSYGKVPSLYRPGTRNVIGMPHWTSRTSYPHDIDDWMSEPDYGICLQTRHVRAFDCDITDEHAANAIYETIARWFADKGADLPCRTRVDSPKFLVLFELPGEYGKRIMKTAHGAIEFLANGQQCLVAGTHKDGARYQWQSEHGPDQISGLTAEEFEDLWSLLELTYAIDEPSISKIRKPRGIFDQSLDRQSSENTMHTDPVVLLLHGKGVVIDTDTDGRVHFTCPWSAEHTMKGDVSETTYFPAGTGGYERGHFLCLHAHCSTRTDADFLDALGWTLQGFDPLPDTDPDTLSAFGITDADDLIGPPPTVDGPAPLAIPPGGRDIKTGIIKAHLENIVVALQRPDLLGCSITYDAFKDDLLIAWGSAPPAPVKDTDITRIRLALAALRFDPKLSFDLTSEAAHYVGEKIFAFDSGIRLAESLPAWDGTPRVDRFYEDYLHIPDPAALPYAAACSRYLWTALAGRLLVPGIQADMACVWVGDQGSGKTSSVKAMALQEDHYVELDIAERDKDLSRLVRGKCIAELAELRGIRTRELESVKAFISRRHEEFVSKYKEYAHTFPRRFVMIGTSNREDFLVDETGNRRFLPIQVGQQNIQAIIRDREQLWAEAIEIFRSEGIMWKPAETLARDWHGLFEEADEWRDRIAEWLQEKDLGGRSPSQHAEIRTLDVATQALHMNTSQINGGVSKRIGNCLRKLGYVIKTTSTGVRDTHNRAWVPRTRGKIKE